jgi:hypothetical protein
MSWDLDGFRKSEDTARIEYNWTQKCFPNYIAFISLLKIKKSPHYSETNI